MRTMMNPSLAMLLIACLLLAQRGSCSSGQLRSRRLDNKNSKSPTPTVSPEPSLAPSESPAPSPSPSIPPSSSPSISKVPSSTPSVSVVPSFAPSAPPSKEKSYGPTESPAPSPSPSLAPSSVPSAQPSSNPSDVPSVSLAPSDQPSAIPSSAPSDEPSSNPSDVPSVSLEPSGQPSETFEPSSMPSSLPTTDYIMMEDGININIPEAEEEVDLEVFETAVTIFIRENIPDNCTVDIQVVSVEVTEQELLVLENVTSFLDIDFNVTSNVGPRPLPDNFDYPYYIWWGFNNNFTGFLATLKMEQEKNEQEKGPAVAGAEDSEIIETEQEKSNKWAIIILVLLAILILLLLLCLCWRCRQRKDEEEEKEAVGPTESDLVEDDIDDQSEFTEVTPRPAWPPRVSTLHNYPFSNVHVCKSAYCATCDREKNQTEFVEVTKSKSWGARIASAFTPRSRSERITPKSWSEDKDQDQDDAQ